MNNSYFHSHAWKTSIAGGAVSPAEKVVDVPVLAELVEKRYGYDTRCCRWFVTTVTTKDRIIRIEDSICLTRNFFKAFRIPRSIDGITHICHHPNGVDDVVNGAAAGRGDGDCE